jgi:hypothetical protein
MKIINTAKVFFITALLIAPLTVIAAEPSTGRELGGTMNGEISTSLHGKFSAPHNNHGGRNSTTPYVNNTPPLADPTLVAPNQSMNPYLPSAAAGSNLL